MKEERQEEYIYAGIPTYMGGDFIRKDEIEDYDVVFLGVPCDYGASYRLGAKYAPRQLREYSFWDRIYGEELYDLDHNEYLKTNDLKIADLGDVYINPTNPEENQNSITEQVYSIAKKSFPLVCGGDHSITYGSFRGFYKAIKERYLDYEVGLIHFDAHMDVEDKYLGIADKNVTKIYLIEDDKLVWEKTLDVTVEKIEVNKNGYMAVVTKDSVYKSVVSVYSNKGELLFKSYVSNGYVIDTEISPDNNYLVIGEVDYSKTFTESTVKVIDVKKAIKAEEGSLINTFVKDKLLVNLKIKENNNILAQYSDSIVNIGYTDKTNKEIYTLQNVYIADIENSRYSFVIKKEEQNDIIKLKNTYVCIIINESGNEIARYNIGETTPKSVLAKLDSIAINLGTELVVINQNGWIRKKYNSAKEISRYDLSSYIIIIWYNDKIDIVGL